MGQQPRQTSKASGAKAVPQAFRPREAKSRVKYGDRVSRANSTHSTAFDVPPTPEAATKQIEAALRTAYESGNQRQIINALLPLTGATDLDDWPGGIRQQFKAAQGMVEQLLKSLRSNADLDGKLQVELLDQGDAVGAWYNDNMLVVIFPTGDTIDKIQQMAEGKKLTLLINPQWSTTGQVVSDFGVFGKRRREDYVNSFETVYSFMNKRIRGEDVRLLLINGVIQVFVLEGQDFTFVEEYTREPSYAELEDVLKAREGSNASKGLFERMQASFNWNAASLKQPPQNQSSD